MKTAMKWIVFLFCLPFIALLLMLVVTVVNTIILSHSM